MIFLIRNSHFDLYYLYSSTILFEKGISIIAFGGYIYSSKRAVISLDMSFIYEGNEYAFGKDWEQTIEANNWSNIGIHAEQLINKDSHIIDAWPYVKI